MDILKDFVIALLHFSEKKNFKKIWFGVGWALLKGYVEF